jgi:eukaryotic-like serine/threonine-protein kinase
VTTDATNLRTTILQAFARTLVDESRPSSHPTKIGGAPEEPVPSASALPSEGDVVGEHYRLVRLLGEGMFGKVYVAERVDVPEHRVALKLLPRSLYAGRNVDRELVMLATVGHPHVVQLKDHGTTPEYVWLTMPVYRGETLGQRLERGPLGLREAYDIFVPIARGLEALHSAGLRHQDVKPENIFLAVFGGRVHPILLDLGVAAEKEASFVAGTALFASPEQVAALSGAHPWALALSEKMDTYGLAATLLSALVAPEHFPGEKARDRAGIAEAHTVRAKTPLDPASLPELVGPPREQLAAAFSRFLALDPNERPPMNELAEQLDVLLEPEREEQRAEARRRQKQRTTIQRFKIASGALVLVGLALASVVYAKRRTIELAGQLQEVQARARQEGEKSFDKIETCTASYQIARRGEATCQAKLERDQRDFNQALEEVRRSGSTSEAEHARQMQSYASRIKACEDSVSATELSCSEEKGRLDEVTKRQQTALEKERTDLRAELEAAKEKLAAAQKDRERAEADRLACAQDREDREDREVRRPAGAGSATVLGSVALPGSSAPTGPAAPGTAPLPTTAPVTPKPPAPPPLPKGDESKPLGAPMGGGDPLP